MIRRSADRSSGRRLVVDFVLVVLVGGRGQPPRRVPNEFDIDIGKVNGRSVTRMAG